MAKYLLMAFTNPLPGREKEYHDWYNLVGIPFYKEMPGLTPLGRFRETAIRMRPSEWDGKFEYVSLYHFEADDPVVYLDRLRALAKERADYKFTDAVDFSTFYEPLFVALEDDQVDLAALDPGLAVEG